MKYLKICVNSLVCLLMLLSVEVSAEEYARIDSRVKTLVYNENDIYKLVVHRGFQTTIELTNGEEVDTISMGSPYAWNITPVGRRIFIKPHHENIHTNMTIITNKHSYNFEVLSKAPENKVDQELAYVVRFYYPNAH